jgi:predicted small lipoprotein YifL
MLTLASTDPGVAPAASHRRWLILALLALGALAACGKKGHLQLPEDEKKTGQEAK